MASRLIIDLRSGHLEVEGSEEFIREIYHDYKAQLSNTLGLVAEESPEDPIKGEKKTKPRRRKATQASSASSTEKRKSVIDDLKVISDLKIDKLPDFFQTKSPKGNPQILLVFAAFLRDEIQSNPCSVDELYTCYWAMKKTVKMPVKFRQAIIDTVNKKKWLEWKSSTQVSITSIGENVLNHELR